MNGNLSIFRNAVIPNYTTLHELSNIALMHVTIAIIKQNKNKIEFPSDSLVFTISILITLFAVFPIIIDRKFH